MTIEIIYFLALVIFVAFAISFIQSLILSGLGSDQSVHIFLANVIKENRYKLFVKVPRIINESFCGGYPLFLHWLIAIIGIRRIKYVEILLNPIINTLIIIALAIVMIKKIDFLVLETCLLFALTPQFYHAFSARNFGISARSLGILLFFLLCIFNFFFIQNENYIFFVSGVICSYLIWGTSTFALQANIFISFLLGFIFNEWSLFILLFCSGILFFILHPKYSISYVWHTIRFSYTYSTKLAKIFILDRRKSIWLDFIYFFYIKILNENIKKSIQYIYENSIIIILFLNLSIPIFLISIFDSKINNDYPDFIYYSFKLTFIGTILFLFTSFKKTRFLGEPERYIEIISPFSISFMAYYVIEKNYNIFWVIVIYYICVNILQFLITISIKKELSFRKEKLKNIASIIKKLKPDNKINFTSNNDEILKYFQVYRWNFARYWSYEEKFCGYSIDEAFIKFPYIKTNIIENVIQKFDINIFLFDKINSDTESIFENEPTWNKKLNILFQDEQFILYKID
ncbi:MAG: hypothetical protein CFH01_01619 [Alphaproteobacteria bacterium MarineAlpha2_Bin1]|nr:MAG: hypothetical protein CFH01_01619 [Alphaproteobacteria bacterium MarineAlpha2_Bin1]